LRVYKNNLHAINININMKKLIVLFLLLPALTVRAQDNIQWRGDRTGIYKETGLLKSWGDNGPELLWQYDGLGEGHSSVAIAAGKIYITGLIDGKGYLYAFDMSGKLLNKKEYGDEWDTSHSGTRGTVTVDGGKLYLISGVGDLICFDEKNLDVLWQKNYVKDFDGQIPKYGVNESPLIVGGKLIATPGGKKNNVVALDKNNGNMIWSCEAKGDISSYCCPIYLDSQQVPQVVTITGHHVVGVDIANGKTLWSFPFTNRFFEHPNTPVYADNMLLCTSSYGVGSVMLRLTEGGRKAEQVWAAKELDSRTGHMLKLGDYAYGSGDNNTYWYCVDWKTGQQMYKDKSLGTGAVIAADGMLYCYSDKGEMALVKPNPAKFDIVGRFSVKSGSGPHWAHPAIYRGILYLRHGDSLMAYKVK
jgi:outer membrane protein assembly factor BamB